MSLDLDAITVAELDPFHLRVAIDKTDYEELIAELRASRPVVAMMREIAARSNFTVGIAAGSAPLEVSKARAAIAEFDGLINVRNTPEEKE